jgi:hypothetical protein
MFAAQFVVGDLAPQDFVRGRGRDDCLLAAAARRDAVASCLSGSAGVPDDLVRVSRAHISI